MANPSKPTATVIGAGIVGVCSAAYLQREGFDVEIVDPEPPGTQCSFGNAGAICPGACLPNAMPGLLKHVPGWLADPEGPLYVRLAYLPQALPWLIRYVLASRKSRVEEISKAMRSLHKLTFDCFEPLVRDAGVESLIEKNGQLFIYSDPKGVEGDAWGRELRSRQGVKIEILNEDELRQLAPALSRIFKRAVYMPEQGQCKNPGKLVEALAAHAVRNGAKLTRARVRDFEMGPEGPTALLTDTGRIPCERVVIAAGAWSGPLARKLGSRVPLDTERGYHAVAHGVNVNHRIATIWSERKFAITPMEMGMRFAGTVEIAGLNAPPDYRRADVLLKHGQEMFPDMKVGEVSRWMGHRPGTPDSIAVIGRAPRYRNAYFAFGHGHQGLMGGSVTGKLIGELVAGKPTSIDLTPFRADRF